MESSSTNSTPRMCASFRPVVDFPAPAEPTIEIRRTMRDRTSQPPDNTAEENPDMSDDQVLAGAGLGRGVTMPMVGFGTWRLRGSTAYESVGYALQAGYQHLDTATMYGNETEVGRAIRDSGVDRADIFITTKVPPGNVGRERATIEASLRDLGTDHVDLW